MSTRTLSFAASHACVAGLFKISVGGMTQDSGLQGFVGPYVACGSLTLQRRRPCIAWDSHTSSLSCRQQVGGQCACPSNATRSIVKGQRARGLPPPRSWTRLSSGGCPSGPPARDPASLHRFPSRVPRPTSGALPWQTHRHSVSGLVCASRLELRMLIMEMQLRQHSIFGWLTRTLDEATLVSGRHTRIHWNSLDIPFRS